MEDHNIVDLYWFRDENAISETDKKYGSYCNTIANNILYNLEDSKECVNDTYLKTWNSIPPTRPKILKAFLGKITRNLALNIYKSKNCQKRKGDVPLVLDELKECIPSQNDIDTEMEEKYLTKYINEGKDVEIFIKGSNEYIERNNKKINEYIKEDNETKIIDCYDVGRVDEYLVDIAQKYNNVIGTAGEKSL